MIRPREDRTSDAAAGRAPNVEDLGLESVGGEYDRRPHPRDPPLSDPGRGDQGGCRALQRKKPGSGRILDVSSLRFVFDDVGGK